MKFYDLHVHSAFSGGKSTLEQLCEMLKKFDYSGFCFAVYFENEKQLDEIKEKIENAMQKFGIEIFLGVEARNPKELKFLIKKRNLFDILLARGGDIKMNRIACSYKGVDILTHPSYGRNDCGLDHVSAKFASQNKVAIEINFREILISSKKSRSQIIKNFMEIVELSKKYEFPLIACSGAISHFEICDKFVLSSFLNLLGLEMKDAKNSVSKIPIQIIKNAIEKKQFLMPGVKIV